MRNGEPLTLEEMQVRQGEMEDRLNAATLEIQELRAKAAAGVKLRHAVADNMTDASQAWAEPAVAEFDAATKGAE